MLENVHIKNVALIEECDIVFTHGLNILSGETGAGKSMVIDSLNFALGERVTKDFLRNGETMARVEALFSVRDPIFIPILEENGITVEEDGTLLIMRSIQSSGKTLCKINGSTVTIGMLRQISELLVDMHGQHEHQSLLNPKKHILLLDKFCGSALEESLNTLSTHFKAYTALSAQIRALTLDEGEKARKIDILTYQIEEIEAAALKPQEEEALLERRKIVSNSEKIMRYSSEALELLYEGSGQESCALDKVSVAKSNMETLCSYDDTCSAVLESLQTISALLEEACRDLNAYVRQLELDPQEVDDIEQRLSVIYNLKRKYGTGVQDILSYCEKIKEELSQISNDGQALKKLEKAREKEESEVRRLSERISKIRKERAAEIEKEIESQLKELEMKNASFQIQITEKKDFTASGKDEVEFLISANKGEKLKPLAKIASGGEMSRVMLAIKGVLSSADTIDTFIFDEIDTGVSGRTAQKVAEKMSAIGREKQILCITHLPQIAAMADTHFLIEKWVDGEKTCTGVTQLSAEGETGEIARLIAGSKITQPTQIAAQDMKHQATLWKALQRKGLDTKKGEIK